ncbi:unnamed protein product [Cuscuta campestris]|uniref:TF-B3 domain-containing protein n=1 Tax=Cuscuta campestris TaxID=132261 RepID=A0A484N173_9ASTE|nr:unnamed protein product [Cuscuta campestris]
MEENLQRFFKVLMPGFHTKIMLPPVMDNEESLIGEEAKESELISRKGRWKVTIKKSCEGSLWFTDGWGEFVRQHDLALGDFVVFKHIGALRFKVTLFDPTCCEKDFPACDLQPQTTNNTTKLKADDDEGVQGQKQNDQKPNNLGVLTRKRGRPVENKISLDQSQLSVVMKSYNLRTTGSYLVYDF